MFIILLKRAEFRKTLMAYEMAQQVKTFHSKREPPDSIPWAHGVLEASCFQLSSHLRRHVVQMHLYIYVSQ